MVKVFFSYATSDRDLYQIPRVAEILEGKSYIDVVFYWEGSASGSIIEYMNNCVKASDTCVFFYSKAAASSGPIKKERDMAVYQGKHIIPVFMDIKDVPEILQIETGVDASDKTIEEVSNKIYHLINLKYKELNRKIKELIPTLKKILQKKIHVSLKELAREIPVDLELIKLSLDKFTIHHEDSNEYWINLEEFPKTIIPFRGAKILYYEEEVLLELENHINLIYNTTKEFKLVNKIEHNTQMGFTVDNYRITGVGLYNCGITTLPESIGFLSSLKVLGLGDNKLSNLPLSIKQLISIQVIILEFNNFEALPPSISNLTSIQELYLRHNKITKISESIKNLKMLKRLDLGNNNLTFIYPKSIENLVSLKHLRLSHNQLTDLPESIGYLNSIQLIELNNNPLTSLPETMVNLKSLKFLYLKGTNIKEIPASLPDLARKGHLSIYM